MMRVLLFVLAMLGTRTFADETSVIDHSRSPDGRYDIVMLVAPNDPDGSAGQVAVRNRRTGKLEPGGSVELSKDGLMNLDSDSVHWKPDSREVALDVWTSKDTSTCYLLVRAKGGWVDLSSGLEKEARSLEAEYQTKDWAGHAHNHLGANKWLRNDTLELEWTPDYYRLRPDGSTEVAPDRLLYFAVHDDGSQPVARLTKVEQEKHE